VGYKQLLVQKFNPNHDSKSGRFTSGGGGSAGGLSSSVRGTLSKGLEKIAGSGQWQDYDHFMSKGHERLEGQVSGEAKQALLGLFEKDNDGVLPAMMSAAWEASHIQKFNPNHDPKNGRFTSGSGGGSGGGTADSSGEADYTPRQPPLRWKGRPFPTLMEGAQLPALEPYEKEALRRYRSEGRDDLADSFEFGGLRIKIQQANRKVRLEQRHADREAKRHRRRKEDAAILEASPLARMLAARRVITGE
jgi:hypothetical protein